MSLSKRWTDKEKKLLHSIYLYKNSNLSALEKRLNRPCYGILQKLEELHKKEPNNWDINKIRITITILFKRSLLFISTSDN